MLSYRNCSARFLLKDRTRGNNNGKHLQVSLSCGPLVLTCTLFSFKEELSHYPERHRRASSVPVSKQVRSQTALNHICCETSVK